MPDRSSMRAGLIPGLSNWRQTRVRCRWYTSATYSEPSTVGRLDFLQNLKRTWSLPSGPTGGPAVYSQFEGQPDRRAYKRLTRCPRRAILPSTGARMRWLWPSWDCPWCCGRHGATERICSDSGRSRLESPLSRTHLNILLRGYPAEAAPVVAETYLLVGPIDSAYLLGIAFLYEDWQGALRLLSDNSARIELPSFWEAQRVAFIARRSRGYPSTLDWLDAELREPLVHSSASPTVGRRASGWGPDREWWDNPFDGPAHR